MQFEDEQKGQMVRWWKYPITLLLMVFYLILLLGPSQYFGYKGSEMGFAVAAGTVVIFVMNLNRFRSLKVAGIEIELNEALQKANATVEQLRKLAKPLILTQLTTMSNGTIEAAGDLTVKNSSKRN